MKFRTRQFHFINELCSNDRLIVVAFSRNVEILSDGNANYEQVRTNIRRAKFGDGTSLYEAVDFAMNKALRGVRDAKRLFYSATVLKHLRGRQILTGR